MKLGHSHLTSRASEHGAPVGCTEADHPLHPGGTIAWHCRRDGRHHRFNHRSKVRGWLQGYICLSQVGLYEAVTARGQHPPAAHTSRVVGPRPRRHRVSTAHGVAPLADPGNKASGQPLGPRGPPVRMLGPRDAGTSRRVRPSGPIQKSSSTVSSGHTFLTTITPGRVTSRCEASSAVKANGVTGAKCLTCRRQWYTSAAGRGWERAAPAWLHEQEASLKLVRVPMCSDLRLADVSFMHYCN
jgi:hypothetical protein